MIEPLAENVEAQQKALLAAEARPTLTKLIPAVAAYTLGVIPISREDEGVVFATFPGICPEVRQVLKRHAGAPVVTVEFDENVMAFFLDKIYLKGHGSNIHTFKTPEFLGDPANHDRLFSAKVEKPEPSGSQLPFEFLALCDLHLASELHNLDRPQPARLESYRLGEFCPAFRRDADGWTIWAEEALDEDVPLLLQFSEDYAGEEFYRDLSAVVVKAWPHVIFPSEVQLLGIDREGALQVYMDGTLEKVQPGRPRTLATEYYLVRHGWRFHRRLTLTVRNLVKAKRDEVRYAPPFRGAGAEELRRWLATGPA